MRTVRFASVFVFLAVLLSVGPSSVLAQESEPTKGTSSSGWVTDPGLMPPGPPPARRPDGTLIERDVAGSQNAMTTADLITDADGHVYWDGSNRWIHLHAWTVATTADYRDVEQWIWRWDSSQDKWIQEGYKKEQSDNINRVDAETNLACWALLEGKTYTQTSRHHARKGLFDRQTITITDYNQEVAPCGN